MIKGIFGLLMLMLVSVVGCGPLPPEVHCDRRTEIEDICLVDNGPYLIASEDIDKWYRDAIECVGEYFPPPKWIAFKIHDELTVKGWMHSKYRNIEIYYSDKTPANLVMDIYSHELVHVYMAYRYNYGGHDSPLFDKCAPRTR